jgi:hypothetical protein
VKIGWIIRPLISVFSACFVARFIFSNLSLTNVSYPIELAFTFALILAFMRITGAITSHDMAYIKNTVKNS